MKTGVGISVKIGSEYDSYIESEELELERKNRLFYQAGLLRDELSNDVLVYGIHGILPDEKIHMGIEGFLQEKEPMRLTLYTVGKLKMAVPAGMETALTGASYLRLSTMRLPAASVTKTPRSSPSTNEVVIPPLTEARVDTSCTFSSNEVASTTISTGILPEIGRASCRERV